MSETANNHITWQVLTSQFIVHFRHDLYGISVYTDDLNLFNLYECVNITKYAGNDRFPK